MKLNANNTPIIKRLLSSRNSRPLKSILSKIEAVDLAGLLGHFAPREGQLLLDALLEIDRAAEALSEVPEAQLETYLNYLPEKKLNDLIVSTSVENATYFLNALPSVQQEKLISQMSKDRQWKIKKFLSYPEGSTGRIMQSQMFTLAPHISAEEGLEILRKQAQEQSIYYIYCVEKSGQLVGVISLRALATAPPDTLLSQILKKEVVSVRPHVSAEEAAQMVSHYDFIALPVVDDDNKLLGLVTVDDVIDIIQEQATADIYAAAGLTEDDRVFSSLGFKIKNRFPWMFLNLFLAALASLVVSLFENTMHELIILASLKNIVAGMGGNTAIQTLTVVTRGLATGDFNFVSYARVVLKETLSGLSIGVIMGIFAGILVYFWKDSTLVASVICASMILNSIVASSFGAMVPIFLYKFKKDPATGSGVIVTMVTDIFSFFSFLGIASLGLMYFS